MSKLKWISVALLLPLVVGCIGVRMVGTPTSAPPTSTPTLGVTVDVAATVDTAVKATLTAVAQTLVAQAPEATPTATLMGVVAAPTRMPTSIPPMSTRSPTATTTAVTSTPTTTVRAVPPTTKMGTLLVKALEGCYVWFSIKVGDDVIGSGRAGEKTLVTVGTYDIALWRHFGEELVRRDVAIREGEETVVDFSQELGALQLIGYPQLKEPLRYTANGKLLYASWGLLEYALVGQQVCARPGVYEIEFVQSVPTVPGSYIDVPVALFLGSKVAFDVEIQAGEKAVVGSEAWPKQLGLLSFSRNVPLYGTVYDLQAGDHGWSMTTNAGMYVATNLWMLAGKYKLVISQPYPGLPYEFEIKAGEETFLQLPDQSSTPTLTKTPTSAPTKSSQTSTITPTPPHTTVTPVMPSILLGPLGTLSVTTLEGCHSSFSIKEDNQVVGTFAAGTEISIAIGTYDIILFGDLGQEPVTKSVVIREGEETLVDFSQELGALLVSGYPQITKPLSYHVYQGSDHLTEYRSTAVGKQYCVLPGIYTIKFTLLAWDMNFEVEIPPGEVTVVKSETWPKQLGLMTFSSQQGVRPSFHIVDQQTGDPVGHPAGYAWNDLTYWMVAGTYKIILNNPYSGLTYENVEIKAGEETVLQLP